MCSEVFVLVRIKQAMDLYKQVYGVGKMSPPARQSGARNIANGPVIKEKLAQAVASRGPLV